MGVLVVSRVLRQRRRLRAHEGWTRAELEEHQGRELAALREFAYARSPFYRRFHRGVTQAPLDELPVLTKAVLMDHFDEISTDPAVRLTDVEAYLENLRGNELFAGRFSVAATSGSSGRKSVIPADPAEWATTIASYARANEWAGITAGLTHRVTMAVVLHHHLAPVLPGRGHGTQPVHRQRTARRRHRPARGGGPAQRPPAAGAGRLRLRAPDMVTKFVWRQRRDLIS